MLKIKKTTIPFLLILLILIPIATFAHFFIFPQQTRSILINYSTLKKDGRLYYSVNTSQQKLDSVKSLMQKACNRVAAFWGEKKSDPKFIYCESPEDFSKYGSSYAVPAITHLKMGSCIVISHEGVDVDIIAHEISHAELYERIGFYNWSFKIPAWFDEGLAMQNDYRTYYSEDTLIFKTDNFKNLPDVSKLTTGKQFNSGSYEQVMINYMAASYEVKKWYSNTKLKALIQEVNSGRAFTKAYGQ